MKLIQRLVKALEAGDYKPAPEPPSHEILADEQWRHEVMAYAVGKGATAGRREAIVAYLYQDPTTFKRLGSTPHGRFVSELANPSPDYVLRSTYRKELEKLR